MEHPPLVSIITVVRNMRDTIEETIQSVFAQTYSNLEYIVIDACSDDGTSEIIAAHEDRIDLYLRERDEGLYHAMNKGIHFARGDLIIFVNGDDHYVPHAIETLVEHKIASGAEVVSAQAVEINRHEQEIGRSAYRQYNSTIYLGMPFCHELMLVPREIYQKLGGYNTAYGILADWDFSIRLFNSGCRVSQLRTALLYMRATGVSITDFEKRVIECRRVLRNNFPFLRSDTLDAIADPRVWDKPLALSLIKEYCNEPAFCRIVWDYGFRRGIFTPADYQDGLLPAQKPLLSIIVPVYNAENTIERALRSVLKSTRQDIEVICVDDGSSDQSREILDRMAAEDGRIRPHANARNMGVAHSRNKGIGLARGLYLFFLDADDEAELDAITKAIGIAEKYNSDVVLSACEIINPAGRGHKYYGPPPGEDVRNRRFYEIDEYFLTDVEPGRANFRRAGEGFTAAVYRTEQVRNIMFSEDLDYGEDSHFLLRYLMQAKRISWQDDVIYRVFITSGSAMTRFHAKRVINTILWRLRVAILLQQDGMDKLARDIILKYWAPDFGQKIKMAELSEAEKNKVNRMLAKIVKLFGQHPNFQYDWDQVEAISKEKAKPVRNMGKGPIVNIFISTDSGGAAIGSRRRRDALRNLRVPARVISALKSGNDAEIIEMRGPEDKRTTFRNEIMQPISTKDYCISNELFSNLGTVVSFADNREYFDDADIVHFHWVTGMIDEENWDMLKGKPFCWTLADMNAFTGGCHYSEGCEEYKRSCENCQLLTSHKEIASEQWARKKQLYDKLGNFTVICPSAWIAKCASESGLLGDKNIVVIPNAMPTDKFKPVNQRVARMRLGIPLDANVILFGADDVRNQRKGGDLLRDALTMLAEGGNVDNIFLMTFGHHSLNTQFPSKNLGRVESEEDLSVAYSAADCFCLPSREDNAPLTVAEAQLCGTPVVATPVGNVPDLVIHKQTGYVCDDFSARSIRDGIVHVFEKMNKKNDFKLQFDIRHHAATYHDPETAAQRHLDVYRQMKKDMDARSQSVESQPA